MSELILGLIIGAQLWVIVVLINRLLTQAKIEPITLPKPAQAESRPEPVPRKVLFRVPFSD